MSDLRRCRRRGPRGKEACRPNQRRPVPGGSGMKLAMVSEHASPLAVLGGVDAGGQNVHVAALAAAVARQGVETVVHTRRDEMDLPRRVPLAPGVTVDHVSAGPPTVLPKDDLLPHMAEFAEDLSRQWQGGPPAGGDPRFWSA